MASSGTTSRSCVPRRTPRHGCTWASWPPPARSWTRSGGRAWRRGSATTAARHPGPSTAPTTTGGSCSTRTATRRRRPTTTRCGRAASSITSGSACATSRPRPRSTRPWHRSRASRGPAASGLESVPGDEWLLLPARGHADGARPHRLSGPRPTTGGRVPRSASRGRPSRQRRPWGAASLPPGVLRRLRPRPRRQQHRARPPRRLGRDGIRGHRLGVAETARAAPLGPLGGSDGPRAASIRSARASGRRRDAQASGGYEEAIAALTSAIELRRELGDPLRAGDHLARLTVPYITLGRTAEAEATSRAAIEILETLLA